MRNGPHISATATTLTAREYDFSGSPTGDVDISQLAHLTRSTGQPNENLVYSAQIVRPALLADVPMKDSGPRLLLLRNSQVSVAVHYRQSQRIQAATASVTASALPRSPRDPRSGRQGASLSLFSPLSDRLLAGGNRVLPSTVSSASVRRDFR